jgi:Fe-S-cluster-containing dehydrogenase component
MASTGAMVAAGDRKVSWQAVWSPDTLPSVTDQSADAAARAQQFAAFAVRVCEQCVQALCVSVCAPTRVLGRQAGSSWRVV